MFKFKVKPFIEAQDVLVQWSFLLESQNFNMWPEVSDLNRNEMKERLEKLIEEMTSSEFEMCRKGAIRLHSTLDRTNNGREILADVTDFRRRLLDQLDSVFCLSLSPQERELYEPVTPIFGVEVEAKFADTAEDIENAGKCLALGQGTACVFHLMRAMERVVQILGRKLDVTIVDRNNADLDWGKIIANMKTPIEAMPKGSSRDNWSEALSLLAHVKQAWRHPTMHPKQTYTDKQAREIFDATGTFMRRLSTLV